MITKAKGFYPHLRAALCGLCGPARPEDLRPKAGQSFPAFFTSKKAYALATAYSRFLFNFTSLGPDNNRLLGV